MSERNIKFEPAVDKTDPENPRTELYLYLAAQSLALLGEIGILAGDFLLTMADRVMEESRKESKRDHA